MNAGLVDFGVTEHLLDGLESAAEEVLAQFLEAHTGEGGVEADTLEEGVDLDGGLSRRRERALSTLVRGMEPTESTQVWSRDLHEQSQSTYISLVAQCIYSPFLCFRLNSWTK